MINDYCVLVLLNEGGLNKKGPFRVLNLQSEGGGNRTHDRRLKRPLLYLAELLPQSKLATNIANSMLTRNRKIFINVIPHLRVEK
jgi:hypothetical protein